MWECSRKIFYKLVSDDILFDDWIFCFLFSIIIFYPFIESGGCKYYIAAGVLLIFSIILLTGALLLIVMFLRGILKNESGRIKAVVLVLLFIGGIFIISGYSSPQHQPGNNYYSYHLAVAAGIFTYISTIFFAYYAGHTSISSPAH